jgi:hypothetical protein
MPGGGHDWHKLKEEELLGQKRRHMLDRLEQEILANLRLFPSIFGQSRFDDFEQVGGVEWFI